MSAPLRAMSGELPQECYCTGFCAPTGTIKSRVHRGVSLSTLGHAIAARPEGRLMIRWRRDVDELGGQRELGLRNHTRDAAVRNSRAARHMWRNDVASLQQFLITQDLLSEDSATGYFGIRTEAGVQSWQSRHGIVSLDEGPANGYGVIGPRTRLAITQFVQAEAVM